MSRLIEILEDKDGRISTNRLCQVMVVTTICACLVVGMCASRPNETIVIGLASIAAASAAGTYSLAKWRDTMPGGKGGLDATASKPRR